MKEKKKKKITVVITIKVATDKNGNPTINITMDFRPPVKGDEPGTHATAAAGAAFAAIVKLAKGNE